MDFGAFPALRRPGGFRGVESDIDVRCHKSESVNKEGKKIIKRTVHFKIPT